MSSPESERSAPRRAGVRDVAEAAGVSTQTVSRVLNGFPHIRDETRARVLAAVDALGYRMNNAARALGTRTTRTLGVIASDTDMFGPAAGLAALAAVARESGRWIATAYADPADPASTAAAVRHLLDQGVDGLVVLAPHAGARAVLDAERGDVPVAFLHGDGAAETQSAAAALAVHHVCALGHSRIAELHGPPDWLEAEARRHGVARALEAAGAQRAGVWAGDWSAASAARIAGEVAAAVAAPDGPTAVVVANDQMALGLIAGLRAHGVAVPTDLSVVGFDDNPDAAFYLPALTSVRLDVLGEARRAIAAVLGEAPPPAPEPPLLVVRASTTSR
ncbi:LacI family DNA-binding transcriptional regulator [Microbacterium sp. X-17]|uniref:LacI family DNA-binding transcriptional regulator n=1 Tax=Microbacterium sp. X-17 TaxID=3144404 RepID=UPI0031F5BE65